MNKYKLQTRTECLKAMHILMQYMNDENAYFNHWVYIIPDDCDAAELESIATDPESEEIFADACKCFVRCVSTYARESGFCLPTLDDNMWNDYGILDDDEDDDVEDYD